MARSMGLWSSTSITRTCHFLSGCRAAKPPRATVPNADVATVQLGQHLQEDVWRQVDADTVQLGHGHLGQGAEDRQALDGRLLGVDGVDVVAVELVGADALVAELALVRGCTNDSNGGPAHGTN